MRSFVASLLIAAAAMASTPSFSSANDFSGLYFGAMLGRDSFDLSGTLSNAADFDYASEANSFRGGVFGGYNLMIARTVLLGIDGSVSLMDAGTTNSYVDTDGTEITTIATKTSQTFSADIRARIGVQPINNLLIYGAAGFAIGNFKTDMTLDYTDGTDSLSLSDGSGDKMLTGITFGAGIEALLVDHFVLRAEYSYVDYGTSAFPTDFTDGGFSTFGNDIDLTNQTFRAGVAFKF